MKASHNELYPWTAERKFYATKLGKVTDWCIFPRQTSFWQQPAFKLQDWVMMKRYVIVTFKSVDAKL